MIRELCQMSEALAPMQGHGHRTRQAQHTNSSNISACIYNGRWLETNSISLLENDDNPEDRYPLRVDPHWESSAWDERGIFLG